MLFLFCLFGFVTDRGLYGFPLRKRLQSLIKILCAFYLFDNARILAHFRIPALT